jgi:hypothetical protein
LDRDSCRSYSGFDTHTRTESTSTFFRPKLRIGSKQTDELTDYRYPKETGSRGTIYPLRKFVKFVVENHGKEPAKNCQTRLQVVKQVNGCACPSLTDKKFLLWENDETRIDIGAKHDNRFFYLVFSQEKQEATTPTYCGVISGDIQNVRSWIATREALQSPKKREQDKICQGQFRVHVDIFTEYGQRTYSDFIIKVRNDWHELDAEKCECNCTKRTIIQKIFRR